MKDYFRSRKGSAVIWAPYLILGFLLFSAAAWKLSSLHIIAGGNRDAVQKAVTQVCTDNVKNVYDGVREGYSGGYKLTSTNWTDNVNESNIMAKLDSNLGTHDGTKTVDGKMQYSISNVSVSVQNAPLAPGADNTQQFTATATYTLTVPINSAWSALPPLSISQKVVSHYSPQGDAVGSGESESGGTPVDGITLSASDMTLDKGDTDVVSASITPDDAEDRKLFWTSTNNDICKVSETGAVTGVNVGSANVVALSDSGKMAECNVTVVSPVKGVSLDKSSLSMIKGASENLTAAVKPSDATNSGVHWTTSDSSVCTVDSYGKVTAVGAGTSTITVMTEEGGYFDECVVNVAIQVSGLTLDKTDLRLAKGATDKLTATIYPSDATKPDILWASSDSNVCSVDQTGNITAVNVGSTVISATSKDGQYAAECNVTVVIPVTGITITPTTLTLIKGKSGTISATVSPDNATDKTVFWSSSNGDIAAVDQTGKVTGVSVGTATVTATTEDGSFTAACAVTVKPNTYTVTANAGYGGTVSGGGVYQVGSNVTLTATPNSHYHFVSWTNSAGTVISTNPTYVIYNLSADATLTANFTIDTFTVNVYGSTGGTATGGGTYAYGTTITLKATANNGYYFIQWDDGALDNPRNYTVTQNATITAVFAPEAITWTWVASTPSDDYAYSEIKATPSDAYYSRTYDHYMGSGTIKYTFTNPFIMHAGQTIKFVQSCSVTHSIAIGLNGKMIKSNPSSYYTYTFTSDTIVSDMEISGSVNPGTKSSKSLYVTVEISSDLGTFKLNSSGTSANQ